jgi:membrane protease YdiL (CAAX protease family)
MMSLGPEPSAADAKKTWRKIVAYCVLTALLSLPGYYLGTRRDLLPPRLGAAVVMWAPGLSAIIVSLVSERSLKGIGWTLARPVWLIAALLAPLAYALPPYLLAWGCGLAAFEPALWAKALPYGLHANSALGALGLILTVGLADKFSRALGEEIGWRGLLVPQLLKVTSFRTTALVSGVIWALWHFPDMLFSDYHAAGTPILFQLGCFTTMVVSSSFLYAWLRMRSASVWPPALLHAAHNLLVQSILDQATQNRSGAFYLTTEFGAGIALCTILLVWLLFRKPSRLSGPASAPHPA